LRDHDLQSAACAAYCRGTRTAVVVVDDTWRLRYANPAGEALIDAGHLLVRERAAGPGGHRVALKPGLSRHAPRFVALLDDVLSRKANDIRVAAIPDGVRTGGMLVAGIGSLAVPHGAYPDEGRLALCSFHALGRSQDLEQRLVEAFGLTPAESRAAAALLAGGTVGDVAARLGVTRNTCKSQLKGAFAKTHTRGQAELLKLLVLVGLA
jgi:DNA-binding CsgD family transcriptional regulator